MIQYLIIEPNDESIKEVDGFYRHTCYDLKSAIEYARKLRDLEGFTPLIIRADY